MHAEGVCRASRPTCPLVDDRLARLARLRRQFWLMDDKVEPLEALRPGHKFRFCEKHQRFLDCCSIASNPTYTSQSLSSSVCFFLVQKGHL